MGKKIFVLLIITSLFLSSCNKKLVAIHKDFPYICFQSECRLKGHGNLKSRKPKNKMKSSFRRRGSRKVNEKVEVAKNVEKDNKPTKTKPHASKPSKLSNDSLRAVVKNGNKDSISTNTPSIADDSINDNSKIVFFINFLADNYDISQEEGKIKKCLDSITIEDIEKVTITGYADSDGSMEYNKKLSLNRAKAVFNYMTSHGIPASKITINGEGELFPQGSNSTEDGKKQNRRVEIVIER